MENYCKCGCESKLRKDNKTGYQKCHKPCEICGVPVKRSDTECCSKSCSAKLHWKIHPELRNNRVWNDIRTKSRNENPLWRINCSISAKKSYQNGRVVWNKRKFVNPNLTYQHRFDKRKLPEYKEWVKDVYKRDKYTCQLTGEIGGKLSPHHLDSWDKHPEKRFLIENGVTIKFQLHKLFHKIYGAGNNTKEQFEEFQKQKLWESDIKKNKSVDKWLT